jgi:hypothetical protein
MFGRTIPNSVVTEHNGRGRARPDNELGRCKRSTYRARFMCRHKSASFTDRWSYAMSDTGDKRLSRRDLWEPEGETPSGYPTTASADSGGTGAGLLAPA